MKTNAKEKCLKTLVEFDWPPGPPRSQQESPKPLKQDWIQFTLPQIKDYK